jgi:hypothetical protein
MVCTSAASILLLSDYYYRAVCLTVRTVACACHSERLNLYVAAWVSNGHVSWDVCCVSKRGYMSFWDEQQRSLSTNHQLIEHTANISTVRCN